MANEQWFYLESDGSQRGPVTLDQLRTALRGLSPQTPVWRAGMPQWMPAASLPELQPAPAMPAPRPAFPAPPPPMAPVGTHAPAPAVATSFAPVRSEEYTLNPWVLLKRSFAPAGRFSRAEFAIAYFTPLLALTVLYVVAALVGGGLASTGNEAAGTAGGVVLLVTMVPVIVLTLVSMVTGLVASIRRCHDLGQSGWLALLLFVPCVNLGFLLYLFFAPGKPGAAVAMQPAAAGSKTGIIVVAVVAGLFVLIVIIGIVAAIAIPSLLRARVSANESMAIGDIRTMISAQAAYQSANNGYYDTPACLAAPAGCIPSYTGPRMLDPAFVAEVKSGYRRTFHGGPPPENAPAGSSPSSVTSFAFVAVPAVPNKTGIRAFCGDSSGVVRVTNDSSAAPAITDGQCPDTWSSLQ